MAKPTKQQKAWVRLEECLSQGQWQRRRGGHSRSTARRAAGKRDRATQALLFLAAEYGITVRDMTEDEAARESRASSGRAFQAAGFFKAPRTIALRYNSFSVLAHEMAHALDHQLGWQGQRSEDKEMVAIAVEYLLCVEVYGFARAAANISYALDWLADLQTLQRNRERIELIYEELQQGLDSKRAEPVAGSAL